MAKLNKANFKRKLDNFEIAIHNNVLADSYARTQQEIVKVEREYIRRKQELIGFVNDIMAEKDYWKRKLESINIHNNSLDF